MKILLLAYHVSPYRGSECSVAWNHITQMSDNHKVTVLYGSSGEHMGDNDDLNKFHMNDKLENVEWHFVPPTSFVSILNILNRNGYFTYSFYLAYKLWHKSVLTYCNKELDLSSFDVVHYLNPIGYREPGYLWKLDKPYVWGPIGGANSLDLRLLPALSFSGKLKLLTRKCVNWFQLRYSLRLRDALESTNLLLTATTENRDLFKDVHQADSSYIPENGTLGNYVGVDFQKKTHDVINIIWIGRIDSRKALSILIDAFKHVQCKSLFKVHVVGKGPLENTMKSYSHDIGLDSVFVWHGHLTRTAVIDKLRGSDLHVITSVSEANTTVIWEAIQCGVPTLSLNHCGMRDVIKNSTGIRIDISSYADVVREIGNKLNEIGNNPSLLSEYSAGIEESFHEHHWRNRIGFFENAYKTAIRDWREKNVIK